MQIEIDVDLAMELANYRFWLKCKDELADELDQVPESVKTADGRKGAGREYRKKQRRLAMYEKSLDEAKGAVVRALLDATSHITSDDLRGIVDAYVPVFVK